MANKKDESLDISKFGIQKFPKDITFERVALWSATDLQKFDEAIKYAKIIISTDSVDKSARDYIYYGLARKGNKQYTDAIAEMGQEDKALECNEIYMSHNQNATPSDYAKLANIYVQMAEKGGAKKQANLDKAYGIYTQMAEKWPTIAAWVYNMAGMQSSKAGQDEKGAEFFQKAVDLLANKTDRQDDETSTLKSALANLGYYYWVTKSDLESAKP